MPSIVPQRGLRMPDDLYEKLRIIAEREQRSYNQQAVFILRRFVEEYETENGIISLPDKTDK